MKIEQLKLENFNCFKKMRFSEDANFLEDLQQFTEFNPVVARNPDDLDYENL
jgi:hypothetical protein